MKPVTLVAILLVNFAILLATTDAARSSELSTDDDDDRDRKSDLLAQLLREYYKRREDKSASEQLTQMEQFNGKNDDDEVSVKKRMRCLVKLGVECWKKRGLEEFNDSDAEQIAEPIDQMEVARYFRKLMMKAAAAGARPYQHGRGRRRTKRHRTLVKREYDDDTLWFHDSAVVGGRKLVP